jgi:hypothetical protein
MTTATRRPHRALTLVLVVVVLAAAGVVYAHWVATLEVDAQIATGDVEMIITSAATDDDGVHDGWELTPDDGGPGGSAYDAWGTSSSRDPAKLRAESRYDKDVARCQVTDISGDGPSVQVAVDKAYPSYHCSIRSNIKVTGSVPIRNQVARVAVCVDSQADCTNSANFVPVPYDLATDSFPFDSGGGSDFELVMQDAPFGQLRVPVRSGRRTRCGWSGSTSSRTRRRTRPTS